MFKDDPRFPDLNVKVPGHDYVANPYPHADLITAMWTRSAFGSSMYGDTKLHFRHQQMENDFVDHPEWIAQIGSRMDVVGGTGDCGVQIPHTPQCA